MRVKIQYLGLVKTYTNRIQDELVLEEDTGLSAMLDRLAADFGRPFDPEVYDPAKKEVKPTFMVLINGIVIGQLDGVNTRLKDGDIVVLMPLVTGG